MIKKPKMPPNFFTAKAKKMTSSDRNDLETLAKLGELRKAGILTEKEFQTKKKKILNRI